MTSTIVELNCFRWAPEEYDGLASNPDNQGYLFCREFADIWLAIFFEALNNEDCWPHLMACVDGSRDPIDAVHNHPALLHHVLDHFRRRLTGTALLSWLANNVLDNQGAQQLLRHMGQVSLHSLGDHELGRFKGFRKLAERCTTRKQRVFLEVVVLHIYETVALPYPEYLVSAASLLHFIDGVMPTLKAEHPDLFLFDGRLSSKHIGLCQLAMDWLVQRFFSKNIVLLRSYGEHFPHGIHFQISPYTFSIVNVSSRKADVLGTLIHEIMHSSFCDENFSIAYGGIRHAKGRDPDFQEEVMAKWAEIFFYGKFGIDPKEDLRLRETVEFYLETMSGAGIWSPLKHALCEKIFDDFVPILNEGELTSEKFLLCALYMSLKFATHYSADRMEEEEKTRRFGLDISYAVGTYFSACEVLLADGLGSRDPYSDRIVLTRLIKEKTKQLSYTEYYRFRTNIHEPSFFSNVFTG